jgi:phage baseplate assembly protein gpV
MHDINDPICLVGMRPQNKVLGSGGSMGRSGGPAAHAGATQIRSDDGNTSITLDGPGGAVTLKTGGVTIVANAGGVTLEAPTVTIKGDLKVTGEVTAKSGGGFVTLSQHIQAGQKPIPNT